MRKLREKKKGKGNEMKILSLGKKKLDDAYEMCNQY